MHDALLVRVLEGAGDLAAIADRLRLAKAALRLQQLAHGEPVHVLHHQEVVALVLASVVDSDDVRVLQPGDDARLALDAIDQLARARAGNGVAQDLHCDPAGKPLVLREPYFGHAARAEQPLEAVSSVYEIRSLQSAMTLRAAGRGFVSRERNIELGFVLASAAFAVVAWRALDAAAFAMPANSGRMLTQFLVAGLAGHVGIRIFAPRAAPQVYGAALVLSAIGLAFVLRLTPELGQEQANWIALGVVLMVASAGASRRYRLLRGYRYTAALLALALLVVTGLFGTTVNGARLWLSIGGHSVQSTELIKLFMLVFLAGFLADEAAVLSAGRLRFGGRTYSALPYVVPLLLTWLMAMAALALLKDLGSIALLLLLAISALYVATGRAWFVVAGAGLLALTALAGYFAFDHVRERIDVWRSPFAEEQAAGYQTVQSLYAIQAGGITGEGLGMGQPGSIPAAETDYVFSAIGEELGLAGAVGVVMVYAVLLFAGLRVALECPDNYGRLLAASASFLVAIQAAIIIAGNLRLIPTTGITLPFVSYGGSSLIVNFILAGLLLGISSVSAEQRQR